MEEYTHDQIMAIEEFTEELKKHFAEKKGDKLYQIILDYVTDIIDIHLGYAQIKAERHMNNVVKAMGGK